MSCIKISCIVPIYNTENYICKCVTSILKQTYDKFELILIDDGSTDSSGKICDIYARRDSRIKVIHQKNAGVSVARNVGIANATGDYITFVDSDDYIEDDYFELAIDYIRKYEYPSLVLNNYIKHKDGAPLKKINVLINYNSEKAVKQMFSKSHIHFGVVACFYKTNICKNIKFDTNIRYGEDLLFKYKFIKLANNIIYTSIEKYHYTFRQDSACNSYNLLKKIDDLKVFRYIMENENNDIKQLIWRNVYFPSLLKYYSKSIKSNSREEKYLATKFRKELLKYFWKVLLNRRIKFSLKAKFLFHILSPI